MIVRKTYFDKCNTIAKDSPLNFGINPVMELNYGSRALTRGIIHFDEGKIKRMVDDKTFPDLSKLRHILHMTNSSSITDRNLYGPCHDKHFTIDKERACSFDMVLFLIPDSWDEGKGFEYMTDAFPTGPHKGVSMFGSSWYHSETGKEWKQPGIYSVERISRDLDLYTSKEGNHARFIIGYVHFDTGNEDLNVDITPVFNKFLTGELKNYGIGIAFSPQYEQSKIEMTQYCGFFTNHTNTFFEPYVETIYDDWLQDDRSDFYLDKDNRLFFYSNVGGKFVNLDELPTCSIDGKEYKVKQYSKGMYYIELNLSSADYEPDTMYYDTWSNIIYKGKHMADVELDFTAKAPDGYFSFGLPTANGKIDSDESYIPSVYGIKQNEKVLRGDIRKVNVECRIPYTTNQLRSVDNMEYRVYVMVGTKELDVLSWAKVEKGYNENYFQIFTEDYIPMRYLVDIRVTTASEVIQHKKVLQFDIVNDLTKERYRD